MSAVIDGYEGLTFDPDTFAGVWTPSNGGTGTEMTLTCAGFNGPQQFICTMIGAKFCLIQTGSADSFFGAPPFASVEVAFTMTEATTLPTDDSVPSAPSSADIIAFSTLDQVAAFLTGAFAGFTGPISVGDIFATDDTLTTLSIIGGPDFCREGTAQLTDTVTYESICFLMNPAWQPKVHEVGALFYPLGFPHPVKSTDGTKGVGATMTIVSTSAAMDAQVLSLLASVNVLELTLPNGDAYYIVWDPATDRQGSLPFSYMDNPDIPPINTWTVAYVEVAAP